MRMVRIKALPKVLPKSKRRQARVEKHATKARLGSEIQASAVAANASTGRPRTATLRDAARLARAV